MGAIVEIDEVVTEVRVDEDDFDRKMRKISKDLENTERDAKNSGRRRGAAIAGGIAGAVAGTVASAATQNSAVQSTLDLLLNIIAAALLPIFVAILPLIQAVTPLLIKLSETISPAVSFLATSIAGLINIASGNDEEMFGVLNNEGNIGFDLARSTFGFGGVVRLGAVGQGLLDPDRSVKENLYQATKDEAEANRGVGDWLGDKASSAGDATSDFFDGVGGWFS